MALRSRGRGAERVTRASKQRLKTQFWIWLQAAAFSPGHYAGGEQTGGCFHPILYCPAPPAKSTVKVPQGNTLNATTPAKTPPPAQDPGVNPHLAKVRDHHDGHHRGRWCCGATRSLVLIPLCKSAAGCPPLVLATHFALPTPLLWVKVLIVGQWESLDQPQTFAQGGMWVAECGLFPPGSNTHVVGACFPAAPCLQPMDEGSCQHYTLLWYYHVEANACRPFIFGGCRGNSNRFETRWKCERRCKTSAGKAAPEPSNSPLPPTRSEIKAGKAIHNLPTSIAFWCPTRTENGLGGVPLVCKGLVPLPFPAHFGPLRVPSRSSWPSPGSPSDGMWVDLWVMKRVHLGTSTGS